VTGYYNSAVNFVDEMRKKGVSIVTVDQDCKYRPVKRRVDIEHILARNGNSTTAYDGEETNRAKKK
jgi:hypothetical protein